MVSDRAEFYRLNALLIEAATRQRKALKAARWATLDENGAYQINEAAFQLRQATAALETVSASLLETRARVSRHAA